MEFAEFLEKYNLPSYFTAFDVLSWLEDKDDGIFEFLKEHNPRNTRDWYCSDNFYINDYDRKACDPKYLTIFDEMQAMLR